MLIFLYSVVELKLLCFGTQGRLLGWSKTLCMTDFFAVT